MTNEIKELKNGKKIQKGNEIEMDIESDSNWPIFVWSHDYLMTFWTVSCVTFCISFIFTYLHNYRTNHFT